MCYKLRMRTIGIRELHQRTSEYLRLVKAGETVEVTDRGRPVALITPLRDEGPLERLRRQGRLRPALGDLLDVEPVPPKSGVPLPSELLLAERADER
jgi:prevent-host-death family protein